MPEPESDTKLSASAERMIRKVGSTQDRMVRARGEKNSFWNSIAVLGVVGWSVALPTLIGVAAGLWIDRHWPSRFSWTLMLLVAGLILGCANAWLHVKGHQS